MRKKTVLIGLALVVIAVVAFVAGSYATLHLGGSISITNVTAGRDSIAYVPVIQPPNSLVVMYVMADNLTNIYLLNGSMFSALARYVASNTARSGYAYILGSAVNESYVVHNSTTATLYTSQSMESANASRELYAIIDNTNGSASANASVFASVLYKPYNYSEGFGYLLVFVVVILLFIIGMVFVVYGLFRGPALKPDAAEAGSAKGTGGEPKGGSRSRKKGAS
jgi:hypothetical protein